MKCVQLLMIHSHMTDDMHTCISLMYMCIFVFASTPLDIAVKKGHKEIIDVLKIHGSKVR